jgi:flagellar biosynthesis/type III secretory pathway chaperone
MDNNIIKKFKTIISQQIAIQDQLKTMNANMTAAIANRDINAIKLISQEIDWTIGQMDSLERDRVDLLLPYFNNDKNRLKHFSSFVNDFPKEDIPLINKLHKELKEKAGTNFEQTKKNELLLKEAAMDVHKNVGIISGEVNRPIKYGISGQMTSSLPKHLVNQRG